jgi:hypothetical protein
VAKRVIQALGSSDYKALEMVIDMTKNLNKSNLNYFFNNIKENQSTLVGKRNFPKDSKTHSQENECVKKKRKPLLIIPEELWDKNNQEARDLFIRQSKGVWKKDTSEIKSEVKTKQNGQPRRPNPGGPC